VIPSIRDISNGVTGAWRLAVGDPDAFASFDMSMSGFWKSFWAIFLAAPFWLWLILSERFYRLEVSQVTGTLYLMPELNTYVMVDSFAYILNWILFPVLMVFIARLLGVAGRFVPFIIARNWALLLSYFLLAMPPVAFYNLGIIGVEGKAALDLIALILELVYLWVVAVRALEISRMQAAAIVIMDFFISLVLLSNAENFYA